MTTEQLKKGEELQERVADLKNHLKSLLKVSKGYDVRLRFKSTNDHEDLDFKYLPITKEQYISLYVQNVEKKILELEQEFKNL